MRRKYRIAGLTSQATRELTWVVVLCIFLHAMFKFFCRLSFNFSIIFRFPVDERGTMKSVVEYFFETYGFVIQHTQWPCLQVGNPQRPNYLPMEVNVLISSLLFTIVFFMPGYFMLILFVGCRSARLWRAKGTPKDLMRGRLLPCSRSLVSVPLTESGTLCRSAELLRYK